MPAFLVNRFYFDDDHRSRCSSDVAAARARSFGANRGSASSSTARCAKSPRSRELARARSSGRCETGLVRAYALILVVRSGLLHRLLRARRRRAALMLVARRDRAADRRRLVCSSRCRATIGRVSRAIGRWSRVATLALRRRRAQRASGASAGSRVRSTPPSISERRRSRSGSRCCSRSARVVRDCGHGPAAHAQLHRADAAAGRLDARPLPGARPAGLRAVLGSDAAAGLLRPDRLGRSIRRRPGAISSTTLPAACCCCSRPPRSASSTARPT